MATKETKQDPLLNEAIELITDIALKGEVIGTHVQRASEFLARAMQARTAELSHGYANG
jgi:hypothetical protein